MSEPSYTRLYEKIENWDLQRECYEKVTVKLPNNPFEENSPWVLSQFYGHELRKIFREEIFNSLFSRFNSCFNCIAILLVDEGADNQSKVLF